MKIEYNILTSEIKHDFVHEKINVHIDRKCENINGRENCTWNVVFSYKEDYLNNKNKWDQFLISFERIRKIRNIDINKEKFLANIGESLVYIDMKTVPNFKKTLKEFEKNLENKETSKTFNFEIFCNIDKEYNLYNFHEYDERLIY